LLIATTVYEVLFFVILRIFSPWQEISAHFMLSIASMRPVQVTNNILHIQYAGISVKTAVPLHRRL
jgi:hypothetical protein